jgi:hypothetical protein
VKGQLRIDLTKHCFQPIDDLAVPRNEFWPTVDMSRLVDFVLLEPPSYMPWGW